MGRGTFQVGSVSWDIFFFFFNFFFLSGGKNDSLKNTKISQKSDVLLRKILQKYSQLFSKIFSQIFVDFGQKWLILHDFSKLQKVKNFQNEKSGSVRSVKQGFLMDMISASA